MTVPEVLLRVADLTVAYRQQNGWQRVLHEVNFVISRGEVFGLVGESGCGKSTIALQLLGYRHPASRVESGRVIFKNRDLLTLRRADLDRLRGNRISFVPQNPMTALDPAIRVGGQVSEILLSHGRAPNAASAIERTVELFGLVGLPAPAEMMRRYPHQLSGGQQQRVCIATALSCNPDLIVLDEPTTGLDVTTQKQIIELLIDLRARIGMSMLYVTHDLGVLSQIADRVGVMYAGHMIEIASTASLFNQPRHPYTHGLIALIPQLSQAGKTPLRPLRGLLRRDELPAGCPFQPRCDFAESSCAHKRQALESAAPGHEVACQRWRALAFQSAATSADSMPAHSTASPVALLTLQNVALAYGRHRGWLNRVIKAKEFVVVTDLSFSINRGETFALVGESGSGKSTVARAISGLLAPRSGRIIFEGQFLPSRVEDRTDEQRREIQYIFQNADASLNPRARIASILARPLEKFFNLDPSTRQERVAAVLADTRLDFHYISHFPDQLSGGERQRIAIARALIAGPILLLCDEILSALDVSVQASILDLLRGLRERYELTMLFIAHDLAVVRQLADRVAVMYRGQLMELGSAVDVFSPPFHPYTYTLIEAIPALGRAKKSAGERLPPHSGTTTFACAFAGRCPWQPGRICEDIIPPWRQSPNGLAIRCHLPISELEARAIEQFNKPDLMAEVPDHPLNNDDLSF